MIDNRLLAKQLLSLCTDWQGKPIVNTVTRDVLHQAAAALVSCTFLKEALEKLVAKLEFVHEDDRYKAVWECAQLYAGPYDGLTYESELKAAQAILSNYEKPQ